MAIQLPLPFPSHLETKENWIWPAKVLGMCDGNRIADCCWAALCPSPLNDRQYLLSRSQSPCRCLYEKNPKWLVWFFLLISASLVRSSLSLSSFAKASISAARGTAAGLSLSLRNTKRVVGRLLGRLNLWFPSLTPPYRRWPACSDCCEPDDVLDVVHWYWWSSAGPDAFRVSSITGRKWTRSRERGEGHKSFTRETSGQLLVCTFNANRGWLDLFGGCSFSGLLHCWINKEVGLVYQPWWAATGPAGLFGGGWSLSLSLSLRTVPLRWKRVKEDSRRGTIE